MSECSGCSRGCGGGRMHVRSRPRLLRTATLDGLSAYGSIDCGCNSDKITHLTSIALTAAALSAPHSTDVDPSRTFGTRFSLPSCGRSAFRQLATKPSRSLSICSTPSSAESGRSRCRRGPTGKTAAGHSAIDCRGASCLLPAQFRPLAERLGPGSRTAKLNERQGRHYP
jgi:hypothetical protein